MTYKSLFKLAIQLSGLYFIFISIVGIPKVLVYVLLLQNSPSYGTSSVTIAQFLSIVLTAVFGLIMMYAAKKITDFFIHTDEPALLNISRESILEMVMIVLGIAMIVTRIPDISSILVSLFSSETFETKILLSTVISIVACIILIYKARAISQFLMKINTISK
jgi:hypothetical protein